jgi:prepilin signal peptidase PulO-like enzyme (type II secretory pathway)
MEVVMQNLIVWLILAAVGWLAGALVNYCADVLPWKRRLTAPMCVGCQANIQWANYLFWPRRCLACGQERGWRTWVVEVVYVLITPLLWYFPHKYLGFWLGLIVLVYFGIVVIIDIEYRLILHQVSLVGVALMLVAGVLWRAQEFYHEPGLSFQAFAPWGYGLWTTLLGGAAGFGFMWVLYALGEVFIRIMARRRGQTVDDVALGFGDVNLAGVLGLLLGWPLIVVGLFFAILIGGFVSLVFIVVAVVVRRYHVFMALPYGPFLVTGAIFVIYFRDLLLGLLK